MIINDSNEEEDAGEGETRLPEEADEVENLDLDTGYEDSDPL